MTGNITLSSKVNAGKNTVIENVEDDVDEHPYSDLAKYAARLFDKINIGKAEFLLSSKIVELVETLREGFIVIIWRVI